MSYSKYVKQYGNIYNRDLIAEIIGEYARSNNITLWENINSDLGDSAKRKLAKLKKEGIIEIFLSRKILSELLDQVPQYRFHNNPDLRLVDITDHFSLDFVHQIALDSNILKFVSLYLNGPAKLQSWSLSWSNKSLRPEPLNGQLLHRDRDDFKSLRFYLYLTDVDKDSGPHYYLNKSHTSLSLSLRLKQNLKVRPCIDDSDHRFMTEEEVFSGEEYSRHNYQAICGKAGLAWLEDGGGIHRGSVPTGLNSRLMFTVTWGLGHGPQYENYGKNNVTRLYEYLLYSNINLNPSQLFALNQ